MSIKKYCIFSGTNGWDEWRLILRHWLTLRRHTDEAPVRHYESAFARHIGAKYAVSFGAGRMALYAILEALDIGEGDEVIVPAFTCVVVPNAVLYRNAKPIYVDIEPRFFNIDVSLIENHITPRTKAIIAQHTFGVPCDIDGILKLAERYRLAVIEDCGHAQGGEYKGRKLGTFGHAAYFTTDHSKIMSTFLGGMVATNSDAILARVQRIQSNAAWLSKTTHMRLLFSFLAEFVLYTPRLYRIARPLMSVLNRLHLTFFWRDELLTSKPTKYPYPSRLSTQQALLGLMQLDKLRGNLEHRREMAQTIERHLGWTDLTPEAIRQYAWLRYSFMVTDRAAIEKRLRRYFDLGVWFTSITGGRTKNYDEIGYSEGSCRTAEYVANHIVNLPTHQRIPISIVRDILLKDGEWIRQRFVRIGDAP